MAMSRAPWNGVVRTQQCRVPRLRMVRLTWLGSVVLGQRWYTVDGVEMAPAGGMSRSEMEWRNV